MSDLPWIDVPHLWKDEMAFLNWMRSQVRKTWSRHPVRNEYIKARQVPVAQARLLDLAHKLHPATKFVCQCEMCDKWFAKSRMEVDHVHGGTGFSDYEGFVKWQHRMLFVGFDDIRHLCKPCHLDVTLCQRYNCASDKLHIYRDFATFKGRKAALQKVRLQQLGLPLGKNSAEREDIYWTYLRAAL